MLIVTDDISISESDIRETFIRASGPGGQHVNKTSTAVQLRFNIRDAELSSVLKARILQLAGSRATSDGEIIIEASRFRSQEQNRQDARDRLISLIRKAAVVPKKRKLTRPTKASKERRLTSKKMKGRTKIQRRKPSIHD